VEFVSARPCKREYKNVTALQKIKQPFREPKSAEQVLPPASQTQSRSFLMRSKLALSALVIASLFGATAIASAQTQSTTGASSEGNVGPDASKMKSTNTKPDKMKSSKAKSGTTTGMSSGSKKGSAAPAGGNE
jgi:hypothetical protein